MILLPVQSEKQSRFLAALYDTGILNDGEKGEL